MATSDTSKPPCLEGAPDIQAARQPLTQASRFNRQDNRPQAHPSHYFLADAPTGEVQVDWEAQRGRWPFGEGLG